MKQMRFIQLCHKVVIKQYVFLERQANVNSCYFFIPYFQTKVTFFVRRVVMFKEKCQYFAKDKYVPYIMK